MNKKIKIVYCGNDAIFEGLYLSILSILRRSKEIFEFYFLSADLSDISPKYVPLSMQHKQIIEDLVKSFNSENSFIMIDCKQVFAQAANNTKIEKNYHTPFASFRLLLEEFPFFTGKVIYLDTDTMANDDIKILYDFDIGNNELAACPDIVMHRRNNNKYFNSGVVLFNMDEIRKTHCLRKALKYLFENKPLYYDQDSLNYAGTKLKLFSDRFNYQKTKIGKDTVIKHFIGAVRGNPLTFGIKQGNVGRVKGILRIHNGDEDYKIFLKARKEGKK